MRVGGLRSRVTIRVFTTHREPSGQVVQVWAEVKGISGRELMASGAEVAEATIRVWVRFRRDITAANRLKVLTGPFAGSTLNIIGPPIPDSEGTRLEILCKTGTEK